MFLIGAAMVYAIIFPLAIDFLLNFELDRGEGVGGLPIELEAKVDQYLTLLMKLIFAFGLCFQLPVLMTLLARVGLATSAGMAAKRKYAILGVFVVAAIFTPPDPLSQLSLAFRSSCFTRSPSTWPNWSRRSGLPSTSTKRPKRSIRPRAVATSPNLEFTRPSLWTETCASAYKGIERAGSGPRRFFGQVRCSTSNGYATTRTRSIRPWARRALPPQSDGILDLDRRHRQAQTALQEMQQRRNEASKAIGEAKRRGEEAEHLIEEVSRLKEAMPLKEEEARELATALGDILSSLPNAPGPDVPDGADESANEEIRRVGEPPAFDFAPKQHFELGEALQGLDFETAAALSGSRFVLLRGQLAKMHRALAQFMLELHTKEHGYTEINTPVLVRSEVLYGTGQLPKFGDQQFRTEDGLWLIPTAEVTLTNLASDRIFEESDLPLRVTAHSLCFRSEAGAAGKDTRGMLRQHQFEKVELVSITHPDQSGE